MPLDVVIAPAEERFWQDESEMKLKIRVRRMKEGRDLRGGFATFTSCFPVLCEGKPGSILPTSLSQPCLPVANVGPTRILPHLYLGSQKDVLNKDLMSQNGITYVLNASNTCPKPDFISDSHFMRIPVNDSYCEKLLPWLEKSNDFIEKAKVCNSRVIVHCLAGISRSATIAIAYIMKTMGLSSDDAYRFVKDRRPSISPNFNFLGQLLEFEKDMKLFKVWSEDLRSQSQETSLILQDNLHQTETALQDKVSNVESSLTLQHGLSNLNLSSERLVDTDRLKRSFFLDIKSIHTSKSSPKLTEGIHGVTNGVHLGCPITGRRESSVTQPRMAGQDGTLSSTALGLNLSRVEHRSSLLLSLGSRHVWTPHRDSFSPGTPTGDTPWCLATEQGEDSHASGVERQYEPFSCQMEFEESMSATQPGKKRNTTAKQTGFTSNREAIGVS